MKNLHAITNELLERARAITPGQPTLQEHRSTGTLGSDRTIMTLNPGIFRPLSPMLKARFEFCHAWKDAYLSQDWLGLQEIRNWPNNQNIVRRLELRQENWDFVPPASVPPENCAIYAVNPYELDETYLVWTDDAEEPQIWEFFGADYKMFTNLDRYLEFILGDRSSDDSIREMWPS